MLPNFQRRHDAHRIHRCRHRRRRQARHRSQAGRRVDRRGRPSARRGIFSLRRRSTGGHTRAGAAAGSGHLHESARIRARTAAEYHRHPHRFAEHARGRSGEGPRTHLGVRQRRTERHARRDLSHRRASARHSRFHRRRGRASQAALERRRRSAPRQPAGRGRAADGHRAMAGRSDGSDDGGVARGGVPGDGGQSRSDRINTWRAAGWSSP